jgi:hypothetical protein
MMAVILHTEGIRKNQKHAHSQKQAQSQKYDTEERNH